MADAPLPDCNRDVFDNGASVGLFVIPKETAEAICVGISAATGARVDWHYIAGRVHIKALPANSHRPAIAPLPDEQVADLCGEANRGHCIDPEHYFKAFRDAERAHGIGHPTTPTPKD